ncbi:MAG: S-layer homology domain-containing protein [Eggerthellaceae bacterium]|nr:S-layer homology domain-containing protein [Eggerthellaceae bacterium]
MASTDLVKLSSEMLFFTTYESGQNYDQGLSSGDGYHALGYYQFDNRYALGPFIDYCYAYDPETFEMFEPYTSDNMKLSDTDTWDEYKEEVDEAWHEAYAADPDTFSALQDTYSYNNYYLPAYNYLASRGIDISGRSDCVKGLCWSVANLFGTEGWKRFVGGTITDSYGNKTTYEGCGLSSDMSDTEFVVSLCSYIIDNVAQFYSSQPQYHAGWQNRYKNELNDCLSYLPDLVDGSWYDEYVTYVESTGLMSGYSDGYLAGRFGPEDRLTRGQMVIILYRAAGSPDVTYEGEFTDVDASDYYADAVQWAYENGITTGQGDGTFGGDDYVLREQVATFLYRYANPLEIGIESVAADGVSELGFGGDLTMYPDVDEVSLYAEEALVWCNSEGIMTGSVEADGTYIRPQNTCTRAQAAKMITVLMRDVLD